MYHFLKKLFTYFLVFVLIFGSNFGFIGIEVEEVKVMGAEVRTFTTSSSWTAPSRVSQVTVECWGGGGGTITNSNRQSVGGGGGGAYSTSTLTVTEQTSYSYVIGAAGAGGTAGGDTHWVNVSTVMAKGGGGTTGTAAGVGGNEAGGVGTLKYSGGNGAIGYATNGANGGGGGGGAGSTGNGQAAALRIGGGATTENGGAGGDGSLGTGTGVNGSNYGGGGGGGSRSGASQSSSGAPGLIRITYDFDPFIITVGSSGSQTTEKTIGATNSYIGGTFTFVSDQKNYIVTQIIISETGTVNADTNLSNVKLFYKQEASCSTTIPGDATAFNSIGVGFSSSKATVTGEMPVGTSQVCVYLTLNIGSGATAGETVLIEITNPSTEVLFSEAPWSCGQDLLDTRDSQYYATVETGEGRCWFAENLNYDNGCTSISWSTTDVGACACYGGNSANCDTYGLLYQWSAAMNGQTARYDQGSCPTGWHVPDDTELYALENYYATGSCLSNRTTWGCDPAGTKLKSTSWDGDNESGFNLLPAGWIGSNGLSYDFGAVTDLWSSRPATDGGGNPVAAIRELATGYTTVQLNWGYRNSGFSVRCIKDST